MKSNSLLQKSNLTNSIVTDDQLKHLKEAIQVCLINEETKKQNLEHPFQVIPLEEEELLTKLWSEVKKTEPDLGEFLRQVNHLLSKLESSRIILAYRPNFAQVKEICQLLRQKLDQNIILKVESNPHLIAGFILEHQGKRYDYSLA